MTIDIRNKSELKDQDFHTIINLLVEVWPPEKTPPDLESEIEKYKTKNLVDFYKILLIWDDDKLVGHTEIFKRDIFVEDKKVRNMALGGVCVRPGYRGRNLGIRLVKAAFKFIDQNAFACSVFQTGVPEFYKKVNCREIHNRFFNSRSKTNPAANPWKDEHIMVYPGSFPLGDGPIDLNGDAY